MQGYWKLYEKYVFLHTQQPDSVVTIRFTAVVYVKDLLSHQIKEHYSAMFKYDITLLF